MPLNSEKKIAVALSGGVDSAVTALLLKEQGRQVLGFHMRLLPEDGDRSNREDLLRIVSFLDIPLVESSLETLFRNRVIDPFIHDYTHNRTPNPCVECNRYLKFGELLQTARAHGADLLATGHYARVYQDESGRRAIRRGLDATKNQSYYLYGLDQDALARILFPLGELTKPEVREIARSRGLPVAEKGESQEICFIKDNDYRRYLREAGIAFRPGRFVDAHGSVLGEHQGQENYTVGQRKGLGISHPVPLYVIRLLDNGDILVGPKEETFEHMFRVIHPSFQMLDPRVLQERDLHCTVQIRYRSSPVRAILRMDPEQKANEIPHQTKDWILQVITHEPVQSPTPGQSAVFYGTLAGEEDAIILGGGIIQ